MRYIFPMACFMILLGVTSCGEDTKVDATMISRKTLFGNPEKMSPSISPDGKWISYIAPYKGVLNVWVKPRVSAEEGHPVTFDTGRGIQSHQWAYDNQHILYVQDNDGDENWNLYKINVAAKKTTPVTKLAKVQTRILAASHRHPDEIIIGLNDREPSLHDPHKVNLKTGEMTKLFDNDGALHYWFDQNLHPVLSLKERPDGTRSILKNTAEGWVEFAALDIAESGTYLPEALSGDGTKVYWLDARGRDKGALVEIDLATKESKVLAEKAQADIVRGLYTTKEGKPLAARYNFDKSHWIALDNVIAGDFAFLEKKFPGAEFDLTSSDLDDTICIVQISYDTKSTQYHIYDRAQKTIDLLFTVRPELDSLPLQPMHPVSIPSRDGFQLMSYLTLPLGVDVDENGRPTKPVPLVVFVHGGPWGVRDTWGVNPQHQWLANRGYGVLSVNYRGSGGFGKKFFMASVGEWGRKMHEDILDAVDWTINEKIADPKKIGILGGSYGGYETLVAMTQSPDVFACGIDIVGPSNIVTFLETIPAYWKPLLNYTIRLMGADPKTPEGQAYLRAASPLFFVDQIKKPLLIAQGQHDPRVPRIESDQIVQKMQENDIPVTYVVYPNEGHGFQRPENKISFWALAEEFLHKHLGGRLEPIGDDIKNSSAQLQTGIVD